MKRDSKIKMESHEIAMTPAQAMEILQKNTINRKIRLSWVEYLAGCIARDEWNLTHQGIALAPDGTLLDGQHRLLAIVKADKAVPMMVTFDVPPHTFAAMDRTKARNNSDVLRIDGAKVALAGVVYRIINDKYTDSVPLSAAQIEETYIEYQDNIDSVVNVYKRKNSRSSNGIRLACLARIEAGQSKHAIAAYSSFAKLDFDNMPNICKALLRQIDQGTIGVRDGAREIMVRAWIAFDPKRANLNTITYKDIDSNWNDICNAIKRQK